MTAEKRVDESWKDSVLKEKESVSADPKSSSSDTPEEAPASESGFPFFVSTLGMQALIALGEMANPATGETGTELGQAKYLIDIIQMLSDKTKGNLSPDETLMIKNLLYDLRMKFVQKSQEPA